VLIVNVRDGDIVLLHDLEAHSRLGRGRDRVGEDTGAESEERNDGLELHFCWFGLES
jgi:hypothetical protein